MNLFCLFLGGEDFFCFCFCFFFFFLFLNKATKYKQLNNERAQGINFSFSISSILTKKQFNQKNKYMNPFCTFLFSFFFFFFNLGFPLLPNISHGFLFLFFSYQFFFILNLKEHIIFFFFERGFFFITIFLKEDIK